MASIKGIPKPIPKPAPSLTTSFDHSLRLDHNAVELDVGVDFVEKFINCAS